MKMKNLIAFAMLAFGTVASVGTAWALGDENGSIRGIHAVPDYQQTIIYPNGTAPLNAGQTFYILVRLLNEDWQLKNDTSHPWYFKPHADFGSETIKAYDAFQPALGISIGGKTASAMYSEKGPNGEPSGRNEECPWYTDLYFAYTVKPGDLGLPVKILNKNGQIAQTEGDNTDYLLYNANTKGDQKAAFWDLTNDIGGEDEHLATFHYCPDGQTDPTTGEAYGYPSQPHPTAHRSFDLAAEGIYVQTVDFDKTNSTGEQWQKGDVWRVVDEDGVKSDGGDRPTVEGSGDYTVFVWSADDSVVYVEPDGAGSESFNDGTGRKIVKISGGTGAPVSFKVRAASGAALGAMTNIYLSSGTSQGYTTVGDKIESSTSARLVKVGPPSDPYITIATYGGESKITNMVATVNYEEERKLKVSVNKPYTENLVIAFNPKFRDVPLSEMNPTNGYVKFLTTVDNPVRAAGICEVTLRAGETSVEFYIYALGSAGKVASYLDLTPSIIDNPDAEAYYKGAPKSLEIRLKDQAPDIIQPAEGMIYSGREGSLIDGFDVEVADNWRDLQPSLATNGYEIVVEGTGIEKFTTNAVHFTDGGVVTLPVRVNASGTALTATVKVKDPQGNISAREVTINSTPKPKAKVQFYADRNMTQPLAGNTFNEGEVPYAGIVFTEGKAPAGMYAFFVPTDANATNLVECDAKTNGLKIAMGDTNSTVMAMNFLDGFTQVNPMKAKFAIRFLSTPTIGEEGTPIDYTDDCGSPTFEVNAVNVSPSIDQVFLDEGAISDGETFHKVPAGIEKLYSATVLDPSKIDLMSGAGYEGKEVWVRWEYTDDYEGYETARANYAYSTNGTDGAAVRLSFTYDNTMQRVRLYALDKDDRAAQGTSDVKKLKWGDPLFTFYVSVAQTQRIIISDRSKIPQTNDVSGLIFLENQKQTTGTQGDFYISLSEIPGQPYEGQTAEPIPVRLTLEQWGDGVLNIHTNYVYFKANEKKEQPIRIDTASLNGGQASEWTLTAEVDMDMMSPGAKDSDGNPWNEHFAPASCEVYVRNVDPIIDSATAKGSRTWSEGETNTVSAGESVIVTWKITDITNDFYEADWKYERFQIEWSVDSADPVRYPNPQVITNDWPRNKGQYSKGQIYGDYKFNVPAQDGFQRITMRVLDGDGGEARRVWWIYVSPAKRLKVDVFGPKATAQSKYKAAKGVGQGLVAAKGTLALCEQFVQTWEYDELTKDADLWAWGYPATNTWAQFLLDYGIPPTTVTADNTKDEGLIPTYLGYTTVNGVPLNKLGNKHVATDTTWYDWATHGDRDATAGEYDSFFYRWVVVKAAKSDEGGSTDSEMEPAPTVWSFDASRATFTLDSGDDKKSGTGAASYGTVEVEAIFSKELRPKDNLGDINADGIPDKIVELYGFGANIGGFPEDDLASLAAYNDDEDFLPNTAGAAIYSSLIPGLPESWGVGQEFTAVMEVRGAYADEGVSGLNDGAHLAGLSQQRLEPGFDSDDVEVRKAARDYSELEMMAWAEHDYAKDWSPERPTDPTKADTDEDMFPDGYEYYFWYKAHVGYLANGIHRYLTGRAYDPKNPGEGRYIPSVVIARLMDPRSDLAAVDVPETEADRALLAELLSADKKTRDTDNDGLPDLLEFELGTNPFDFDTDRDGLPDGWEVMISKTEPLKWATDDKTCDAMLNTDGDAMSFTTPKLEESVSPKPFDIAVPIVFAVMDADGDSDGVQWYAVANAPAVTTATNEAANAWSFRLVGDKRNYISYEKPVLTADGILARTLAKGSGSTKKFHGAFVAGELSTVTNISEDETETNVFNYAACGFPVRIEAGTRVVASSVTSDITAIVSRLAEAIPADAANACWTYGATGVGDGENSGFGKLAIGRNQAVPQDAIVVSAPAADENVAYLHYLVYQQFGFDPRTAWNAKTPLASRWSTATAGKATRTREYTAYDEFLLLSFFLNNGTLDAADVTPTQASDWERIWKAYTTNPNLDTNGADTDGDGVPDGWELYVMSGPKKDGKFVFAGPSEDLSPFVKKASTDSDGDGLTEYQEFEGTDTMAYYGSVASANPTIVHDGDWKWFNKFFPTDPWNTDTDNDGLSDANEIKNAGGFNAKNFLYAESDTGKTCVPGGGLNPCSVDTDQDGLPDGWEAQFAGSTLSPASTNTVAGLIDGMDGTVKDAFTTVNQPIDRDYDHDGLDNWQEYLVGAMRCWRYDDPISRWTSIPTEYYFDEQGDFNPFRENGKYLALLGIDTSTEDGGVGEFWYRTLFDKESRAYNPRLVTDTCSGALYFSRVTNGFDPNFTETGAYYIFYDRIGDQKLADLWGGAPKKYISCSPLKADTDGDGMDDYYELFHGLNPILGQDRTPVSSSGGCDIIFDAWGASDSSISALYNVWTTDPFGKLGRQPRTNDPANNKFDFELFPWLNGLESADADGDDIRNQDEAIMPMMSPQSTWHHTDPSALWFTDSSYANSLVSRFYRMPATYSSIVLPGKTFEFEGKTYSFSKADGYRVSGSAGQIAPLRVDQWDLTSDSSQNWMFSFEENEGYDTDHDGISDFEELQGKPTGTVSDPQYHDSPYRRQAMYFAGEENPSALQSMPFFAEEHPRHGAIYPDDMSFLQYTVECWVRPEETDANKNYTILERAIWSSYSAAGDEELLRKNFQLAIRGGCWYTKFDANGTLKDSTVELQSTIPATPGKWTHLAATYDGAILRLYVNGVEALENGVSGRGLKPEYGSSAVIVHPGDDATKTNGLYLGRTDRYWWDREYPLHAFILGASAKNQTDLGGPTKRSNSHLNVANGCGWGFYKDFFKGYIDEVRIWDGARKPDEIRADMTKRYTAADAKKNRTDFYDQWAQGIYRYSQDGNGNDQDVVPELRYHWSFDSLPGAENPEMAAKAAHGYGYVGPDGKTHAGSKAPLARPVGYEISWWKTIVEGYAGTVYDNLAYVMWVPNTVTHLPRFDSSTLDSFYWAQDTEGAVNGSNPFVQTAEPVSRWVQYKRQGSLSKSTDFRTTSRRFWQANVNGVGNASQFFEFTGRHLNQIGDDLLPLGGAFVKYVDAMWDDQGASSSSEITGTDEDNNGLADWWQKYAAEHYSPEDEPMAWKTFVTYRGRRMTAGEAYLLDLARGYYADEAGNIVTDPDLTKRFINRADADKDGMPDWWEKHYGIHTGDRPPEGTTHANEDPDNDGLSNYNEYLLSEVFDFAGLVFDPTDAFSVDPFTPDYFYRVGELYVGEIFTDHDLVDDAWEDLYPANYASRLAWDAFNDADQDGWSNRSENRYSKMVMPIVADQQAHHTAADGLVADYPIPTLALKLSYNGNRQDTVRTAPMAIQVTTDATLARDPDASYLIGATVDTTAGTGTTSKEGGSKSGASTETSLTRTLGKWSNRHAIGTLTPGNIKNNSLALQFCYDPSSVVYSWDVLIEHITGRQEWFTKRGTRTEYDADRRKYGEANVKLLSATPDYAELADLEMRSDESSSVATWIHTKSGQTLGTVNLITGEFDLNLGVFKDQYVAKGTNANDYVSLEDQTFRIAYTANPSVGLPRELYLGEANTGHVKEGKNMIMAWAETVAADGVWQPEEPYGIIRDVDVSWRGTKAEIELTDISPVTPRISFAGASSSGGSSMGGGSSDSSGASEDDPYSDRRGTSVEWILQDAIKHNEADRTRLKNNRIETVSLSSGSFKGQRIRVVRWLINDVPVRACGVTKVVILDKTIETDVRSCFTEADILDGDNAFDIDWKNLYTEVINDGGVRRAIGGEVTRMCYLIVVGDGDVGWDDAMSTNVVKAFPTAIVRKFGEAHVKPVAVAPGAVNEEIVHSANPTFKWTMDCPEEEGYTAFNVQVMDGSTVIYDSGKTLAPPRNIYGEYVWSAPLYVGDKTTLGKVFENKKVYTWKVSMYNAKFSNAANYSDPGKFFMEVQTNGIAYGTANVAVRYFGPSETYTRQSPVVRVQAFTSPDFTGKPVAAGYVADPSSAANGLSVANREVTANCHVVGFEPGSYYLQAFIDSNGNGICDRWETQGYLCARDGSTPDWLNPTTINFGTSVGPGDLAVIYLEDADIDADGLPDAWEYAVYGSLAAKGVELLTETKAGEQLYNKALTNGELALQDGAYWPTGGLEGLLGSRFLNNAGMVSLAMGAPAGNGGFTEAIEAALAPDLAEGGVAITELGLKDGNVTVALDIVTTSSSESPLAKLFDANGKLTVVCEILWTPSLAQAPKVIYSEDVVVGDAPVEFNISAALQKAQTEAGVDGSSAFFSANVYKK